MKRPNSCHYLPTTTTTTTTNRNSDSDSNYNANWSHRIGTLGGISTGMLIKSKFKEKEMKKKQEEKNKENNNNDENDTTSNCHDTDDEEQQQQQQQHRRGSHTSLLTKSSSCLSVTFDSHIEVVAFEHHETTSIQVDNYNDGSWMDYFVNH